jgi:hypothetical protein
MRRKIFVLDRNPASAIADRRARQHFSGLPSIMTTGTAPQRRGAPADRLPCLSHLRPERSASERSLCGRVDDATVSLSSIFTKTLPRPGSDCPVSTAPSSGTVATTFPPAASITVAEPPVWLKEDVVHLGSYDGVRVRARGHLAERSGSSHRRC